MKSREQIARSKVEKLPVADQLRVLDWVELGNPWEDSLINSGVCSGPLPSTPYRMTPREAERQRQIDQFNEESLARRMRDLPADETTQRRQSAEHEAAHCVVALSLGRNVGRLEINANDASGGSCFYQRADDPMDDAVIALAGKVWLEQFRYREPWMPPRGVATGCDGDVRRAQELVGYDMSFQLSRAFNRCKELLRENAEAVIVIADRLDRDGEFRPYPAMTPRVRPGQRP